MTREEIIDKIHDFLLTHHANVECDTCINVFEDLRSLIDEIKTDKYPENHWHSVADGDLPKRDGRYIVMAQNGYCHTCQYHTDDRYWDTVGYQSDIKYWMEIPKL